MSASTTQLEDQGTPQASTIRLPNGKIHNVKSNISIEADEIPVIDVSGIYSEDIEDRKAVAEKVREASHRIGFFYAINHGIDPKYADGAFEQAKRFFALPLEKKLEVDTARVPGEFVGYHAMELYSSKERKQGDLSEAFNLAYDANYDPEAITDDPSLSIWLPESDLPGFKDGLYAYHTEILKFARKMTRIFALALHLPEEFFADYIKRPEAGMRILHYPQQEYSVDDQNGIGAHTDFECFTMVTQDESSGLEVLSKSGDWIKAKPIPGSFVINIGDCLMRQTNDFFVSTVHRVINMSGNERYSIPFFYGFDRKKILEPVPTCVSEDNPMKYPLMTSGEYYKWRASKAKDGEL
ncbi:hypothetical protein POJ06DRAFT_40696 [Lipomyces tetrasporus]|uniref:Fe2OG dioxygenase domain-containing protein n=1 Tax=Lipomyces tetrasporus TaxID=54092 RepID=A0AAD7VPI1_9ASCO|nr:uncharacterized protein POJ06DRAFT_40696 [Lipomyces tetrasporus]KAJ8097178.1 hypothetical protein POJ06DRAFT_40696 [Lipomyces tetrasporus]